MLLLWSLSDYCSAMDLAEQFRITNQIALAKLGGRGASCKMLFICTSIWPAAFLFPNWVRTPCSHVHVSGMKLKVYSVIQRWASATSNWEPQFRNQKLCFCPCHESSFYYCDLPWAVLAIFSNSDSALRPWSTSSFWFCAFKIFFSGFICLSLCFVFCFS